MNRTYLKVPFERKDDAKALGAKWDPGAKLWWVVEGIQTPFETTEHDYKSRQEKCRGTCFRQISDNVHSYGCGACEIQHCPTCDESLPQYVLDCNEGLCMNCAVIKYSGRDPKKEMERFKRMERWATEIKQEELEARANGSKPCCLFCGGTLVAVGHNRLNGKDHEDWNERLYHKACYKKKSEEYPE